jgi:collagenase-like PrtC family protease
MLKNNQTKDVQGLEKPELLVTAGSIAEMRVLVQAGANAISIGHS